MNRQESMSNSNLEPISSSLLFKCWKKLETDASHTKTFSALWLSFWCILAAWKLKLFVSSYLPLWGHPIWGRHLLEHARRQQYNQLAWLLDQESLTISAYDELLWLEQNFKESIALHLPFSSNTEVSLQLAYTSSWKPLASKLKWMRVPSSNLPLRLFPKHVSFQVFTIPLQQQPVTFPVWAIHCLFPGGVVFCICLQNQCHRWPLFNDLFFWIHRILKEIR